MMQVSEPDRLREIEQHPDWAFLKGEKSVADLLLRADRGQLGMTNSDVSQLNNLKDYYDPDYLLSRGDYSWRTDDVAFRAKLAKSLSWSGFDNSTPAVAREQIRPLTLEDYDVGMNAYLKGMNLESIEPLRLIIRFVS